METPTMGKVQVTARIENLEDLYKLNQGSIGLGRRSSYVEVS